jgi:hypothetical protein
MKTSLRKQVQAQYSPIELMQHSMYGYLKWAMKQVYVARLCGIIEAMSMD